MSGFRPQVLIQHFKNLEDILLFLNIFNLKSHLKNFTHRHGKLHDAPIF